MAEKRKKKWIPSNLHKGRCKHMGSAECPVGSPQYNLAVTFKKHAKKWSKKRKKD